MKRLDIVFLAATAAAFLPMLPAMAQESVVYSFPDQATGDPVGHLLLVNGALYGASTGGSGSLGTVFQLKKANGGWKETTVHAFSGSADGAYPAAGLIADANGVLYGTTVSSGGYNGGTFFSLKKSGKKWTEQTLWKFGNPDTHDGAAPACELLMDVSGAIYGTTLSGGAHNLGTVFKLTNAGGVWTSTVLYSFAGGGDGSIPRAGLVTDDAGVLYGTTYYGGTQNQGTAFALTPSGNTWSESVIYSFGKGTDGRNPCCQALVLDTKGDLYGTTLYGGANDWGIVFELVPSATKWREKIVHTFGSGSDGRVPNGLSRSKSGVLVGTTTDGGQNFGGTVFQLVGGGGVWTETVVTNFANFSGDGFFPQGGVTLDSKSGILYGTAEQGGSQGWGAVYQIVPE